MSSSSTSIYDQPRPKPSKPTSTPTPNLTFASTLSSLLSTPTTTKAPTHGRPRPSKTSKDKDSIFTAHNKNTKKRALADISSDYALPQTHSSTSEAVSTATLSRSKRKLEEKARLYASMKRGDYIPPTNGRSNKEENALVDFDRKWAESQIEGEAPNFDTSSGSEDDDAPSDDEGGKQVEYTDEFGRLRTGSRATALRAQRLQSAQTHASHTLSDLRARPAPPPTLIHGDTIQTAAFNPDAQTTAHIAALAQKRDRSMTPPEEVHYDASKEVRSKGVGFYSFSKDTEGRKREMEALERERAETERGRREREERREEKRRKVEERRRLVAEKRGEKMAERFLDELGGL